MARLGFVSAGRRAHPLTIEHSRAVNRGGGVWYGSHKVAPLRSRLALPLQQLAAAAGSLRNRLCLGAGVILWLPPFMGTSVIVRVVIGAVCGSVFAAFAWVVAAGVAANGRSSDAASDIDAV